MTFTKMLAVATGVGVTLGLTGAPALAQEAALPTLEVGEMAPAFSGTADNGEIWNSRNERDARFLVVYFYPAAMTGGCTTQACLFRDNHSRLLDMGAEVIGVSGDRIANLRAFKGTNRLNFPLLSDTAGVIARAFGVPTDDGGTITREVNGEEMTLTRDLTASRWTFIIGPDGRIVYKATDVDPAGDPAAVVAFIEKLNRG